MKCNYQHANHSPRCESSAGFTMVELIITIALLSFGIIGVYSAFSPIIATSYTISARFTAAYLAQEGLEVIRNMRDTNFINQGGEWSEGLLNCQLGCQLNYKTGTAVQGSEDQLSPYDPSNFLRLDQGGFYSYALGGQITPFTRKVVITPVSSDILKVDATVFWNYNGQEFSFQADNYLYNWY